VLAHVSLGQFGKCAGIALGPALRRRVPAVGHVEANLLGDLAGVAEADRPDVIPPRLAADGIDRLECPMPAGLDAEDQAALLQVQMFSAVPSAFALRTSSSVRLRLLGTREGLPSFLGLPAKSASSFSQS